MYNASGIFTNGDPEQWLTGVRPTILRIEPSTPLEISYGQFGGPANYGDHAHKRWSKVVRSFNPSIVTAPPSLCPRCAYVAAVRADVLNQCDIYSPIHDDQSRPTPVGAWFKNTAIAVLDSELRLLGWTWLISRPHTQLNTRQKISRNWVPPGVADGFAPPWHNQVYDTRLLNHRGRLLATWACFACKFAVSLLQLTADQTSTGGIRNVRAWATERVNFDQTDFAQGRNQALFVSPTGSLMVQPWLGIIGLLGQPTFATSLHHCYSSKRHNSSVQHKRRCGNTPPNTTVRIETFRRGHKERAHHRVKTFRFDRRVELVLNQTEAPLNAIERGSRAPLRAWRHIHGRVSTTANLVHVSRGGDCDALLGVGHIHRRQRGLDKAARSAIYRIPRRARKDPPNPFLFGSQYSHFWYTLSPNEPHRLLGVSREFCLASAQDEHDCESVQFLSSLQVREPEASSLLVGYGVNDCQAKIGEIALERIWHMLKPMPGMPQHVCESRNKSALNVPGNHPG